MNTNGTSNKACLTDENLYSYLTQNSNGGQTPQLEAHLAGCPKCRKALADLIELLHPEHDSDSSRIPEPTVRELEQTLQLVQDVSRREQRKGIRIPAWVRWPIAAAAAISLISVGLLVFQFLDGKKRSEAFFAEAKQIVDQSYTGASPSNLRLSLPFNAVSGTRDVDRRESLRHAENILYQALAVRENMVEAHLGLGYIYLNGAEYAKAREEFKTVLRVRKDDRQALIGHGVTQYEEARQSTDPLKRMDLLKSALTEFESILKLDPISAEARYDKIMVLFEYGLHKEALKEIDSYLMNDSSSTWAEELRHLKTKLQVAESSVLENVVDRAATTRDSAALSELAGLVPYKMPGAIWSAMRRSLQLGRSPASASSESPSSEDLFWAASTIEASYGEITGDHSLRNLIRFYVGLSPPERRLKRSLDAEFQKFTPLHKNSDFDLILSRSSILESHYTKINDRWMLMDLFHLRGNIFYGSKADFRAAEQEYRRMLVLAEEVNAPEPMAKALAGIALVMGQEQKYDDSITNANRLRDLAGKYQLSQWQAYAAGTLGTQYRRLGRLDLALTEYADALGFAARIPDKLKMSQILESSGLVMDYQNRRSEANSMYNLAIQLLDISVADDKTRQLDIELRHLNLLLRRGDLAMRTGELDRAESAFAECLESAKTEQLEIESRARVGMAEIYLLKNQFGPAEDMLNKAVAISESGGYADSDWKAKYLQGRVFETTDRPEDALSSYRQSIAVLGQMRQNVSEENLKRAFLSNRYDPFKSIVGLLYNLHNNERALELVDQAKAATLKEDLSATTMSRQHAKDLLDSHSAILEYFFTNEGLLVFFSADGRIEASLQKLSSSEMSNQVEAFADAVRRNDSKKFAVWAEKLYQELIRPVEKYLKGRERGTLVVLPDGPLHRLPFAGLRDDAGRYLIEKMPIVYAPSRTVFNYCLNTAGRKRTLSDRVVLIDGTQGLPFARSELAYISKLFAGNVHSLGAGDLSSIDRAVRNSTLLHFSGHAILRQGQPVLALQTTPAMIFLDGLAISNWKCAATGLVNLAGCATATGPVAAGESPWGLIPAFLNAGAPSIVASLMPVDDESTKILDCRFYDLLTSGVGKARALQSAQLFLLNSARQQSGVAPQTWVPYILVGNPR